MTMVRVCYGNVQQFNFEPPINQNSTYGMLMLICFRFCLNKCSFQQLVNIAIPTGFVLLTDRHSHVPCHPILYLTYTTMISAGLKNNESSVEVLVQYQYSIDYESIRVTPFEVIYIHQFWKAQFSRATMKLISNNQCYCLKFPKKYRTE